MGSVKDLKLLEKPSTYKEGLGIFYFTDDYSVFDYGKMPDTIPDKGAALCRMSSYNFEQLKKIGITSHFLELVSNNEMKVKLVRVLDPKKFDLSKEKGNYLVPLEVIFRNSLPSGSSLLKRLNNKEVTLADLGLKELPKEGTRLKEPLLDVSTKLEEKDRYLKWAEAQKMSGLSDKKFQELKETALKVNEFLTEKANSIGLEHADGKIEFGVSANANLMIVDVLGTLDENRFLYNGIHLSKQVLRDYYNQTQWKEEYLKKGKSIKPPRLPKELITITSNMYKAVAEAWIGKKIWNAPKIEKVVEDYELFLENTQKMI